MLYRAGLLALLAAIVVLLIVMSGQIGDLRQPGIVPARIDPDGRLAA